MSTEVEKLNDHELADMKTISRESSSGELMVQKSPHIMSFHASLMLSILLIWTAPCAA